MSKRIGIAPLPGALALALLQLACSSTTFQSTWRSPQARPLQLSGRKVVAVFMSKDPVRRRRAEDAMAREITARGAQGVPGYTVIADDEIKDEEAARRKLEPLGFSGVVVMRVVGRETQYTYEPGYWEGFPHYRRFWGGYWGWGWGQVYQPGYLTADQVVKVETLVYSLEQDQLVWAGVSKTFNPSDLDSFIAELAKAVTKEMKSSGLLVAVARSGFYP
jgi:hypothetical protein